MRIKAEHPQWAQRRVEVSGSLQQGQGSAGGSRYSYYVILLPNYGLIVEVAISAILR